MEITWKHLMDKAGLAATENLFAAMDKLYTGPASSIPREALWDHHLALTKAYASKEEPERTITTVWKSLTALG